jgi:anti-sigma28 factor (negative regulator of flagellin synthesis)
VIDRITRCSATAISHPQPGPPSDRLRANASSKKPNSILKDIAAHLCGQPPPIDHPKIMRYRQAVIDGEYRVDANKLAAAMLDHLISDEDCK